jgi:hypothetical protein
LIAFKAKGVTFSKTGQESTCVVTLWNPKLWSEEVLASLGNCIAMKDVYCTSESSVPLTD